MRHALALALLATAVVAYAAPAQAATSTGTRAHAFTPHWSGPHATNLMAESKLWFHDGGWWGAMIAAAGGAHTIHRLEGSSWQDTGVVIDERASSRADVLSFGSTLYVLTRAPTAEGGNTFRRFAYATGGYRLDSGFPISAPGSGAKTTTVARDAVGVVWLTYKKSGKVYVARWSGGAAWGAPFVLPVAEASGIAGDDIAAIVSFEDSLGSAVGVMWGNQNTDAVYFAVHRDGAADSVWTLELVSTGANDADDHLNLKAAGGRVYAAVKTSKTAASDPLIRLLVRSESGGWWQHTVARVDEKNTRPIAVVDTDAREVYVFMTIGEATSSRGISYKRSPLDSISFAGPAVTLIQGAGAEMINNATSTKQNANNASGIVVLASDTSHYWFNRMGGSGPGNAAPVSTHRSASALAGTPVAVTLSATDAETCELAFRIVSTPSRGSVGTPGAAACSPGSPNRDTATVTYISAPGVTGSDTFTYRANDGSADSNLATVTVTVTVDATNASPVAADVSASTSQATTLDVELRGTDAETCELQFSIVSPPENGTLGTVADAVCTSGGPHSDRARFAYTPSAGFTGSDTFTYRVSDGSADSNLARVTVTVGGAAGAIEVRGVGTGVNGNASTLVIAAPAGVVAGEFLLASLDVRGGSVEITPPAGWTLVRSDASGGAMRKATYYRVAGNAEPASYSWSFDGEHAAVGGIVAFAGVDPARPIDAAAGQANASSATVTAPSVTTTVPNALLVAFFGVARATALAPPSGMTERFEVVAPPESPYRAAAEAATMFQAVAGATGERIASAERSAASVGHLIALRPSSS